MSIVPTQGFIAANHSRETFYIRDDKDVMAVLVKFGEWRAWQEENYLLFPTREDAEAHVSRKIDDGSFTIVRVDSKEQDETLEAMEENRKEDQKRFAEKERLAMSRIDSPTDRKNHERFVASLAPEARRLYDQGKNWMDAEDADGSL